MVEDSLVLDSDTEESLLELVEAKSYEILFRNKFISCECFKDVDYVFGLKDKRREMEGVEEISPSVVDDFSIVFLLSKGEVGVLEEELKDCLKVGSVFGENSFDILTLVKLGYFRFHFFLAFHYAFIVNLYLFPQFLPQLFLPFPLLFLFFFGLLDLLSSFLFNLLDFFQLSLVESFEFFLILFLLMQQFLFFFEFALLFFLILLLLLCQFESLLF